MRFEIICFYPCRILNTFCSSFRILAINLNEAIIFEVELVILISLSICLCNQLTINMLRKWQDTYTTMGDFFCKFDVAFRPYKLLCVLFGVIYCNLCLCLFLKQYALVFMLFFTHPFEQEGPLYVDIFDELLGVSLYLDWKSSCLLQGNELFA